MNDLDLLLGDPDDVCSYLTSQAWPLKLATLAMRNPAFREYVFNRRWGWSRSELRHVIAAAWEAGWVPRMKWVQVRDRNHWGNVDLPGLTCTGHVARRYV